MRRSPIISSALPLMPIPASSSRPQISNQSSTPATNSLDMPSNFIRLHSQSPSSLTPPLPSAASCYRYQPGASCTLGAPFSMFHPCRSADLDEDASLIDTFAPRSMSFDLSPTSSASSDSFSSHSSFPTLSFDAFVATRSRVVRFYNMPALPEQFLSALFHPQNSSHLSVPVPATLWVLRDRHADRRSDSIWAVFKSHDEACAALSLSGSAMSVATALESDLEPFHKLKRFVLSSAPNPPSYPPPSSHPHRSNMLSASATHHDLQGSRFPPVESNNKTEYTISSNPPNPRTSFRLGDWICSSPKCAAHNFGRNLACIGCGCPRSSDGASTSIYQTPNMPSRVLPSPRFASSNNPPVSSNPPPNPSFSLSQSQPAIYHSPAPQPHMIPQKSAHPLLTPSGRAFAVGGKVQNVSSDPLSPCVMYWPDNEAFPEQGQIRPSGLVGVPQPPILNTGNRGPISHQPGDWICLKCNYLNWRRRKVCQTCLPYAEGNGDSISAAVQAERIALLTSVLTQAQFPSEPANSPIPHVMRSHSLTPPQGRNRAFTDISPPHSRGPVHRSQSYFDLGAQYANSHPIYQTSGYQRQSSPLYSTGPEMMPVHAPAPLLPSFLQDLVQPPALSPSSTSSADLSFEEYDDDSAVISTRLKTKSSNNSAASSPVGNIWKLDGEESKSLSAFALPNHHELVGGSRKNL